MRTLNSPISGKPMEQITLEGGLNAWHCEQSGGHYIQSDSYFQWLQLQPARLPHLPESAEPPLLSTDSTSVLICPESGTFMSRFKVGHGFPFSIDRSITGGVWFDGGEWEALRQRNFHDEIHLVFTSPWQKQVRNEKAQATYQKTLEAALGVEMLDRLTSLRDELADHPHRNLALAYLADKTVSRQAAE